MRIAEMFQQKKLVLSFEVFPPKKTSSIDTIYQALDGLSELKPDFISVTYGAGGSSAGELTSDIASIIRNKYGIESMAHLTCVNSTRQDIENTLELLKQKGIENILALRGDINPDIPRINDFRYASDLISFIKEKGDFHISGACYPEAHPETRDKIQDIRNLKQKVDMGAEHLVSQLFFDNNDFYSFMERAWIAGIAVPVEAGIMPVVNKAQIERMVSLCGASLPVKFIKMMQKFENSPEAMRDAGIAYAVDQIVDLVSNGVRGIHLYTMNNPAVAKRICDNISGLREFYQA